MQIIVSCGSRIVIVLSKLPTQIVPGKISKSLLHVIPKRLPGRPDIKFGVNLSKLPSVFNSTLLITPVLEPASKLPFIIPPKLLAVYSSIPLVLVSQITIGASSGPSGFTKPGPLQSPSTGLACSIGTAGQSAGRAKLGSVVDPGVEPSGS